MKKVMLIALVFLLGLQTIAQNKKNEEIPKEVKKAFAKDYPNAKNVKWDMEDEDFEASFVVKKVNISVIYDEEAELKETETEISTSALPENVLKYISENYKDYKITGAAKIVDEEDILTYEAEITKGKKKQDLTFNKDGIRIIKVKKYGKNKIDDND